MRPRIPSRLLPLRTSLTSLFSTKPLPSVLSGVQPTGSLHLGNWLGSVSLWPPLQDTHTCSFCVVDLHSITNMPKNPDVVLELRENTLTAAALYIASGVDPERSSVFVQSHVKQHAELNWLLSCSTPLNWLERMIQYKEKARTAKDGDVGVGLLTYPVLMASDILLYGAESVPVGEDQRQHLELTRDLARRFNDLYCKGNQWKKKAKAAATPTYPVFREPKALISEGGGARVMSLTDGTRKMSKSDPSPLSRINVLDGPDAVIDKVRKAKTDEVQGIFYGDDRPEANNLLDIYLACAQPQGEDAKLALLEEVRSMTWGDFKPLLSTAVNEYLAPIQGRYEDIRGEEGYLEGVLREGKESAEERAEETVRRAKIAMGFLLD